VRASQHGEEVSPSSPLEELLEHGLEERRKLLHEGLEQVSARSTGSTNGGGGGRAAAASLGFTWRHASAEVGVPRRDGRGRGVLIE
jgi:hypothetical protein